MYQLLFVVFVVLLLILKQAKRKNIPGFSKDNPEGNIYSVNFFGLDASRKFGDIYRMWKGNEEVIVIANYNLAKDYYRDHLDHVRDPDFSIGPIIEGMLGNAIGTKYGEIWKLHRKALKFMVQPSFLAYWTPYIHELCDKYVGELIIDGKLVVTEMSKFTIRVMAKVLYGDLTQDKETELLEIASLHDLLLTNSNEEDMIRFKEKWSSFHDDIIPKENTGYFHMVNSSLSREEIFDNLDELLLFNVDVMYTTLGALVYNLSKYPVYNLDDFIRESARCNPSIVLSFPERAAKDYILGDYLIKKSTIVLIDAATINSRFGGFDPTRRILNRDFHRFGLGVRTCLGQKFAEVIIRRCAEQIIKRFKILPTDKEIKVKDNGLCFFTPYSLFPSLSVKFKSAVLCGISLGNSFYSKKENIENIFRWWSGKTDQLVTFIPEEPSYHTYKGKNPLQKDEQIRKKCRNYAFSLHRTAAAASQDKNFNFYNLTWRELTEGKEIYDKTVEIFYRLYGDNEKLRNRVNEITLRVIGEEGDLIEGTKFLLKELAFLSVSKELLDVESVIYSYHQDFPIVSEVLSGNFGYPKVEGVYTMVVK